MHFTTLAWTCTPTCMCYWGWERKILKHIIIKAKSICALINQYVYQEVSPPPTSDSPPPVNHQASWILWRWSLEPWYVIAFTVCFHHTNVYRYGYNCSAVSLPHRSIQEHSELKIEQRIDEVGENEPFFFFWFSVRNYQESGWFLKKGHVHVAPCKWQWRKSGH